MLEHGATRLSGQSVNARKTSDCLPIHGTFERFRCTRRAPESLSPKARHSDPFSRSAPNYL